MKKCPNCNQEVSNGIQVCPNCGEFIDGDQTSKEQDNDTANSKKNDIEEMPEENYPEEELKKQQKDERSDFGRTDNDK